MKRYAVTVAVTLLVVLNGFASLRASSISYTVEYLGTTSDGFVPTITGMNAAGQISGYVDRANGGGDLRAVRYTGGAWQYIPGLENTFSAATGINASGALSGYESGIQGFRAFRYSDGSGLTILGVLPGGSFSRGLGINDNGDVVGDGPSAAGTSAWKSAAGTTSVIALPALPGFATSQACGINSAGWIAGTATTSAFLQHAYRISPDGVPEDLGSLDGPTGASSACAIDESGRVGGNSSSGNGSVTHAFRYDQAPMVDVDSFGSPFSTTNAVSNGVSVGSYSFDATSTHAFVQSGTDAAVDLNDRLVPNSGWVLAEADAVNSTGQIAGNGYLNGIFGVFRLTPQANDTTAPVISGLTATPSSISTVNGQLDNVAVNFMATDDSGQIPTCQLSASGPGVAGTDYAVTGPNSGVVRATGGSSYTFTVTCKDAAGNSSTSSTSVGVQTDKTAPVISGMTAAPSPIWPPKGQIVTVSVNVAATDDSGVVSCKLTGITLNGASTADAQVTGDFTGSVKAVGGRVYTFAAGCVDFSGNTSSTSVNVTVTPDTTAPTITHFTLSPSTIDTPNNQMVAVQATIQATDDVDVAPSCLVSGLTGSGAGASFSQTGPATAQVKAAGGASYIFTATCSDFSGNKRSAIATVTVLPDTNPPVISSVTANPSTIWPPNGKMEPVSVMVTATDNVDPSPVCSLTSITGGSAGSSSITGQFSANVRSDNGTVYTLTVTCRDFSGNKACASTTVVVGKTNGNNATPNATNKTAGTVSGWHDDDRDDRGRDVKNDRDDRKDRDDRRRDRDGRPGGGR